MPKGFAALLIGTGLAIGREIVQELTDVFIREPTQGIGRLAKYQLAKLFGLDHLLSSTFDEFIDTDPDFRSGLSTAGIMSIVDAIIKTSLWLQAVIGEEMGEELLLELVQEGLSNAIQTSMGGSMQTILNTYRGGSPLFGDDIPDIIRTLPHVDDKIAAFNLAQSGMNIFATLNYLIRGAQDVIADSYSQVQHQLASLFTRSLEEELWPILTYLELARNNILVVLRRSTDITEKYIDLAIDGIRTSLARVNDMIRELEGLKDQVNADVVEPDYADRTVEDINVEYNKLKEETDRFLQDTENAISQITITVASEDIDRYKDALNKYREALKNIIDQVNSAYVNDFNAIFKSIEQLTDMLFAYRYFTDYATYSEEEINKTNIFAFIYGKPLYRVEIVVQGENNNGSS